MSLRSWFRGSSAVNLPPADGTKIGKEAGPAVPAPAPSTGLARSKVSASLSPFEQEIADMEDAMASAALILNDNIEGAEARLRARKDNSAFHQLGLGVSTFMGSVLGFEKEIMTEATNRLLECESRAWADMKKAQKDASAGGGWLGGRPSTSATSKTAIAATEIYPPGSEFALVHAEAQLMLAVVGVLHESLTEAIKGFYKLRKAFIALNTIMEAEEAFLKQQQPHRIGNSKRPSFSDDMMPGAFDDAEFADLESDTNDDEKSTSPGNGSKTALSSTAASSTSSVVVVDPVPRPGQADDESEKRTNAPAAATSGRLDSGPGGGLGAGPDAALLTNPVDIFVHSGANMCFGILLLLISMVPPAFSRLLYIIGFKGDRDRGVRMLWQSTKFPNINGGMAGQVLLAYYNGLMGNSDILPSDTDIAELAEPGETVGYPRERCRALLKRMRTLYPDSMLWRVEEARQLAASRRTKEAIALLSDGRVGRMRQITAISKFELAVDAMCVMDWPLMRDTFLQCAELNNWSHALYYYNAGCAEVELYRTAFHKAAQAVVVEEKAVAQKDAAKHKKAAEAYLRKAPTMAGKKKFMARQMPFDVFVIRKISKWEERATALKIDLADAVGISPTQEMVYLWNGCKRMSPEQLEESLTYLDWERCTASSEAVATFKATPDESAIGSLCRMSLLRSLGRLGEARTVLEKEMFVHDRAAFKGPTKDDYVLAAGNYEAAVICYIEACDPALYPSGASLEEIDAFRREKVEESEAYLDKVAKWETFVLDARIGMRLQNALETIRWLKKKKHWA